MKRVKIYFPNHHKSLTSHKKCWISIPESYRYVSDLQHEICLRFFHSDDSYDSSTGGDGSNKKKHVDLENIYLAIDEYALLPNEV